MHHDYIYKLADDGVDTRHEADKIMIDKLNKLENKNLNWNEWFAKKCIKGIIGVMHKLGLGLNHELERELHKSTARKVAKRQVFVSISSPPKIIIIYYWFVHGAQTEHR